MRILTTILFLLAMGSLSAQTTISAGPATGTWKKANGPYKVNGQIYVPKDSTLKIENGVKVEFQGAYMIHVYGAIQALGKKGDSVLFTTVNKSTTWQGIHIHGKVSGPDSNIFDYCHVEYASFLNYTVTSHGALFMDSVTKARISNSLFYKNRSNAGGACRFNNSKITMYNVGFVANEARDDASTATQAGGAAILGYNSSMNGTNLGFYGNSCYLPGNHVQDSLQSYSTGTVYLATAVPGGVYNLKNIEMIGNSASLVSGLYTAGDYKMDVKINGFRLINNRSIGGPAIYISHTAGSCSLSDVYIYRNKRSLMYGQVTHASAFTGNNVLTTIIDGMKVIDQDAYCAISSFKENYNRLVLMGSDSIGILNNSTSIYNKIAIKNSVIVNNSNAIQAGDGTVIFISNSTIAYNSGGGYMFGGLFMDEAGSSYNVFNSIIQNNYWNGKMSNIACSRDAYNLGYLKNSIVQGGMDSTKNFFDTTHITVTNLANLIKDTVGFIKPPKGAGPSFYDTTSDFHYRNTCSYVYPGWNQGLNKVSDGNFVIDYTTAGFTDLDGNPRIKCGTIDIGPYELEGSKKTVSIDQEPKDSSVCPRSTMNIAPTTCGASLAYQWQKSSTSATSGFSNISGATSVNYSFVPKDSAWYRLIISQNECSKKDTSRAAKIAFKPGSTITISAQPRDTGICAKTNLNLKAGVQGSNLTYRWQNSKDNASFADISGATTNPYSQNIKDTSWYRLIIKNTLCNYQDTTKAAKVSKLPLPTPNLGADQTLPNNGSATLTPGTFSSYQWNYPKSGGATTATLKVDKTNLDTGKNNIWVKVTNSYGCSASDTVVIDLRPLTGIQNPAAAGIGVYPVPMQDKLLISPPDNNFKGSYTLSDLQGRILLNGTISAAGGGAVEIPVSNLAHGTYILTIQSGGKQYGVRVVK